MTATETLEFPKTTSSSIDVTIVVPVRNEARHIRNTLRQLLALEIDRIGYEIIVVDGDSTDETREIVREIQREHPRIRFFSNPGRLSSAARNIGVIHARGEFIVIVDGHCEIQNRHYLHDLVQAFKRSGADCLGRPQPLDVEGASRLQRAIAAARLSWLGHHPASHIYSDAEQFVPPQSVAVAYRQSVFDRVGLFDETFDACEDYEFNHRIATAGLTCYSTPRIKAVYHPRSTLRALFYQMKRYGKGRARLLRKHSDTFSPACLVPAIFVLGLATGPFAALCSTRLAALFAAAIALYCLAVAEAVFTLTVRTREIHLAPWLIAVFPAIHIGAGWGFLQELIHGWFVARRATLPVGRFT
jgi:succinoglycan biosynthesis protein ExoA